MDWLYRAYQKWLKPFADFETVKTVEQFSPRRVPMIEIMGYVFLYVVMLFDRYLPDLQTYDFSTYDLSTYDQKIGKKLNTSTSSV